MQVSRPLGDDFRRFRESRVAIAPISIIGAAYTPIKALTKVPVEEIHLNVTQHCRLCGVQVRQGTAKTVDLLLCQGCRRRELQRQSSLENIRPASPMTDKSKSDDHMHLPWTEVDVEVVSTKFRAKGDAGFFRSMEVLTCFRSEMRRGLRLLSKAATAEKWHMCWAILLSICLMPLLLTFVVVAGVGFLVLSTLVAITAVVVFPLAYINPRLYDCAMDS
ncbi:hypothetical protein P3T76_013532 [Phytophthora citrophthora]|uniref:Transmembrane protein n=1 Tax=Phytophthora citrophthora TaxID=4793 RepID=A0AAD9G3U9_9STRA|nr:hypothetical protein P3T76_013532 [Phytophthora citrophthora]